MIVIPDAREAGERETRPNGPSARNLLD